MSATPNLIHAYRHLYRAALRAVQFSKPARYSVRDQMRAGFRDRDGILDPEAVERTLEFLEAARAERGLEHRILKNLVRVTWERSRLAEKQTWADLLKERKRSKALLYVFGYGTLLIG
jgi:hypothetical protein